MKKKGLGSTPEASLGGSSHTSTSSAGQDKEHQDGFLDEVLQGEDIDALRIKEDSLTAMVCYFITWLVRTGRIHEEEYSNHFHVQLFYFNTPFVMLIHVELLRPQPAPSLLIFETQRLLTWEPGVPPASIRSRLLFEQIRYLPKAIPT